MNSDPAPLCSNPDWVETVYQRSILKCTSTSRWLAITYLHMEWLQTTAMHPTNPNCFQVNFLLIIFYKTLWLLQGHLSQEEECWRGCWGKERKKNDLKYQWLKYIVQNTRPWEHSGRDPCKCKALECKL